MWLPNARASMRCYGPRLWRPRLVETKLSGRSSWYRGLQRAEGLERANEVRPPCAAPTQSFGRAQLSARMVTASRMPLTARRGQSVRRSVGARGRRPPFLFSSRDRCATSATGREPEPRMRQISALRAAFKRHPHAARARCRLRVQVPVSSRREPRRVQVSVSRKPPSGPGPQSHRRWSGGAARRRAWYMRRASPRFPSMTIPRASFRCRSSKRKKPIQQCNRPPQRRAG